MHQLGQETCSLILLFGIVGQLYHHGFLQEICREISFGGNIAKQTITIRDGKMISHKGWVPRKKDKLAQAQFFYKLFFFLFFFGLVSQIHKSGRRKKTDNT
ncbi:hypothetical protein SAY86_008722 [Trapa natans]|uniref:Uncharacterized protein n=1 Tax=Trapa natans TaxID=22666 RepID=A0AAN7K9V8_TRANT|nr:hypothetical protein SAY86_008722 [Trapa natans]